MHIAFLTWRDTAHPDGGGSEVYVERVAAELAGRGHRVTIRCAEYDGSVPVEQRGGVRIVRRGRRLTVYPRGLLWLLTRDGRSADVVVDVVNGIGFFAPIVRRRGVIALVHHLHREQWQIIYPGFLGKLGWFLESRLMPLVYRAVTYVVVSEATRGDLAAIGLTREHLHVIYNGTAELPVPRTARAAAPRLCVLSRLVPHKQIDQAIEVTARLRRAGIPVTLDVIGDGWWAPQIRSHVRRLDASEYVIMHGRVDEQTKSDLLASAWLMLLPSVKEGWGQAILEAASVGTPTIAYAGAGGVNESIVHGHTGLLARTTEDLFTHAQDLITSRGRLAVMGQAAREHAARYRWESTGSRFEALCLDVKRRSRPYWP